MYDAFFIARAIAEQGTPRSSRSATRIPARSARIRKAARARARS